MITVHMEHRSAYGHRPTFTGSIHVREDGCDECVHGVFPLVFSIAHEFRHRLGDHCENIVIDMSGYNVGTYTF